MIRTWEVGLRPVGPPMFSPTEYPDLHAAEFQAPGPTAGSWVPGVSVQSTAGTASHVEARLWDGQDQVEDLAGLPYVRVVDGDGRFLTSSRLEAHRLASAYIRDSVWGGGDGRSGLEVLGDRLGVDRRRRTSVADVAAAVAVLDPLSVVHGVFFAHRELAGQPRLTRLLTMSITADDIRSCFVDGYKRDDVDATGKAWGRGGAKEGYGHVPTGGKTLYTAQRITLWASYDRAQLRAYRLDPVVETAIAAIVDYELALLTDGPMRLRSDCILQAITRPDGILPLEEAAEQLRAAAAAAVSAGRFRDDPETVTFTAGPAKKAGRKATDQHDDEQVS